MLARFRVHCDGTIMILFHAVSNVARIGCGTRQRAPYGENNDTFAINYWDGLGCGPTL